MPPRDPGPLYPRGQTARREPEPLFHGPSILLGLSLGLLVCACCWLVAASTYCGLKKSAPHYLTDDRITWQSTGMVPKGASGRAQQAPTP